ncbi:MAG: hypothetical protein HY289_10495 [Planctomycetes bacterium]|nr:hypothetical protein [Planctomycetota bacterium]
MNVAVPNMDDADRAILERAAGWPLPATVDELTQPVLQEVAGREGIDFATALLYDRLVRRDGVHPSLLDADAPMPPRDVLIGVVPGAFYKEYTFTGADGQRVLDAARRAGCRAELVPLLSFGPLAEQARILCDWLKANAGQRIMLVSLSKGGTDVAHALSIPNADQLFRDVAVWLNLSGIVQGTALADWLLAQRIRSMFVRIFAWWRGYPFKVVSEIRRRDTISAWPAHLRVIHVVGFPLRRHLSNPWAVRAHNRLEPWGPSDAGGILLADAVRWPGTIIPLWGVDHYLQDGRYDVASLAMRLLGAYSR